MAECAHESALAVEPAELSAKNKDLTVFFCPDCGDFIDESGDTVPDPTKKTRGGGTNAGKAQSPHAVDAQRAPGRRIRSQATMETIKCSWPGCKNTFQIFPQNLREKNWCPTIHRAIVKTQQVRERVKRFREQHGQRS